MFDTSHRTLKLLAALVWYSGVVVLTIKGTALFIEAEGLNPAQGWTWVALFTGVVIGVIKARYLFGRLCRKNLLRIEAIERPRLWQFYRPQFFIFLFTMIALGGYLSRLAHGDYAVLLSVAGVDLSIATALLGSGHLFWKAR